jgi:hypothetical protein
MGVVSLRETTPWQFWLGLMEKQTGMRRQNCIFDSPPTNEFEADTQNPLKNSLSALKRTLDSSR